MEIGVSQVVYYTCSRINFFQWCFINFSVKNVSFLQFLVKKTNLIKRYICYLKMLIPRKQNKIRNEIALDII